MTRLGGTALHLCTSFTYLWFQIFLFKVTVVYNAWSEERCELIEYFFVFLLARIANHCAHRQWECFAQCASCKFTKLQHAL